MRGTRWMRVGGKNLNTAGLYINILAGENEGLGREVGGTSKKKTLLVAHRIKLQEEVQLVKEYTRRIMQRKESFW